MQNRRFSFSVCTNPVGLSCKDSHLCKINPTHKFYKSPDFLKSFSCRTGVSHSVSAQTLWVYLAKTAISVKSTQHTNSISHLIFLNHFHAEQAFLCSLVNKSKICWKFGYCFASFKGSSSRKKVGIKFCYFSHYFSVVLKKKKKKKKKISFPHQTFQFCSIKCFPNVSVLHTKLLWVRLFHIKTSIQGECSVLHQSFWWGVIFFTLFGSV